MRSRRSAESGVNVFGREGAAVALALGLVSCSAGGVLTDHLAALGQGASPAGTTAQVNGANASAVPAKDANVVAKGPAGSGGNLPSSGNATVTTSDFFMGVHINWDTDTGGVAGFIKATGFVPSVCAGYVTAKSDGTFELSKARSYADDVAANGGRAISYAITAQVNELSSQALADLGTAVTYARGKNLAVFVRYGYEMNGNWSPAYHGGNPAPFLSQWAQAERVVHAAGGAMVWAPNLSGSGDYKRWMPDASTIDQVGLDAYHQKGELTAGEVDGFIASIYPVVQTLQKPFVLTETAVVVVGDNSYRSDATEVAQKQNWLNQLVDPALRAKYPLYRGFVWFDYEKTESASGVSNNDVEWRNFAISVDALAAAMVRAWYPTVFGATSAGSASASPTSTGSGAGANTASSPNNASSGNGALPSTSSTVPVSVTPPR